MRIPHIETMRVKNFKAFKDSGLLKLAKINLIVGKNSAGKSSLMKAILGCSQTASERKVDSSDFRLVGMLTDLGTFKDTIHGKNENANFSISFGSQFVVWGLFYGVIYIYTEYIYMPIYVFC